MDQDLVLQRLWQGAYFLGGVVVIGLGATWFTGWLCRRLKVPNGLTLLAQVLTPAALFYAASLYLDAAGIVARAEVTRRTESIKYADRIPGGWSRTFWAFVEFSSADGPNGASLWLSESAFDALHVGDRLDIRYVPAMPFIARPADVSTRGLIPDRWLAGAALVVATGVAVWRGLRRWPALRAATTLGAMLLGVVSWVFPTPWETPLAEPVRTAEAEVRQVRDIDRSFVSGRATGSIEAPQPWQLAEVTFVPEGRDQAVVALDGVDVGSVPGLERGRKVAVAYNPAAPRDVRLVGGARTYRWREWLELAEYLAILVVLLGAFAVAGRLLNAWWRRLISSR